MAIPPAPILPDKTRQRLIEAAGEIFADQGFHRATVRDICARAGANIAAVNYYFGDKQSLYAHALRYAHACAFAKYPADMGLPASATPQAKLEAFIRSFLLRLLDAGRPAWHARLMTRELAEPTPALDVLVNEQIRPNFLALNQIIRDLLGPAASESTLRMTNSSVIGQCLFYHFGAPISSRLMPGHPHTTADVPALSAHITSLTLAGIKQMAKEIEPRRARKTRRRKEV